jgi:hypothetical protein
MQPLNTNRQAGLLHEIMKDELLSLHDPGWSYTDSKPGLGFH